MDKAERERFEAEWMRRNPSHHEIMFSKDRLCGYANTRVQDAWSWWQARAKLPASAPSVAVDEDAELVTAKMLRAAQLKSELGAYATSNLSGAYDLISELYYVMRAEASKALQELTDESQRLGLYDQPSGELGKSAEQDGCEYCNDPLFAAIKCRYCGRIVEKEQENIPDGDDYEERKLRERNGEL